MSITFEIYFSYLQELLNVLTLIKYCLVLETCAINKAKINCKLTEHSS